MDWKAKLSSRKFWICVAAFLGSLGTGISGLVAGNQTLALVGGILTVVSAAIYAFCEAWVDAKAIDTADMACALINELESIEKEADNDSERSPEEGA